MKKIILIFSLIFSVLCAMAQKDVYVLVDLSGSICLKQRQAAREVLSQLLKGDPLPSTFKYDTGDTSDLRKLRLTANDMLSINGFGERDFTWYMSPKLTVIQNNSTIDNIMSINSNWEKNANWTYYDLAKAKIAEYARKNGKKPGYVLCVITDGNNDFPPNTNPYTDEQHDFVNRYQSKTEGVNENGLTQYILNESTRCGLKNTCFSCRNNYPNLHFKIYSDVNISNLIPRNPIINANDGINIITPTRAKSDNPFSIYDKKVKIEWKCTSKSTNLTYTLALTGYDGNSYNDVIDTLTQKSVFMDLENGKYKIIVSANSSSIIPDTTYINVNVVKNTKIQIMSPSKGTSQKPSEVKSENVNVSWRCPDCDDNTTYSVTVSGIEGAKHKENPRKIKGNSASFKLPGGKYKITVSGTDGVSSDTTYIKVEGEGTGGFLVILLLIAAVGIGSYFFVKNLKNKKPTPYSSNSNSDNNSSNSNGRSGDISVDTADDGMF